MENQSHLNLEVWLKHHARFKNFLARRLGNKEYSSVDHYRREGVRRAALPKWVAEKELDLLPGDSEHHCLDCHCRLEQGV